MTAQEAFDYLACQILKYDYHLNIDETYKTIEYAANNLSFDMTVITKAYKERLDEMVD